MGIHVTIVIAGDPAECYGGKGGEFLDRDLMVYGPDSFQERARGRPRRPDIVTSFNSEHWGSGETGVFIDGNQKLLLLDGGDMARWDPDWSGAAVSLIGARWAGWDARWFAQDWEFVAQQLDVPRTLEPNGATARSLWRWEAEDPGPGWIHQLRRTNGSLGSYKTLICVLRDGVTGLASVKAPVADVIVGRGPSIVDDIGWKSSLTVDAACTEGLLLDYDENTFTYYGHTRADFGAPKSVFHSWTAQRVWSVAEFEQCVGSALTVDRISREALVRQVVSYGCGEISHLEHDVIPGLVLDLGYEDLAFELAETPWPWAQFH